MDNRYGVYIGEHFEAVITEKYTIVYRRNVAEDSLDSYLLSTVDFTCIGAVRSIPATRLPDHVLYAMRKNSHLVLKSDDATAELLGKPLFLMSESRPQYTFTFFDGEIHTAEKAETFDKDYFIIPSLDATSENVGECLNYWQMGVQERIWGYYDNELCFHGVDINTLKHMYVFFVTEDFIYCRAARHVTCNKGTVFNQNFRINSHKENSVFKIERGNFAAFEDNREALKELDYDESIFAPNACIFDKWSIYWSVISVSKDEITLQGCGGEIYKTEKPK